MHTIYKKKKICKHATAFSNVLQHGLFSQLMHLEFLIAKPHQL